MDAYFELNSSIFKRTQWVSFFGNILNSFKMTSPNAQKILALRNLRKSVRYCAVFAFCYFKMEKVTPLKILTFRSLYNPIHSIFVRTLLLLHLQITKVCYFIRKLPAGPIECGTRSTMWAVHMHVHVDTRHTHTVGCKWIELQHYAWSICNAILLLLLA